MLSERASLSFVVVLSYVVRMPELGGWPAGLAFMWWQPGSAVNNARTRSHGSDVEQVIRKNKLLHMKMYVQDYVYSPRGWVMLVTRAGLHDPVRRYTQKRFTSFSGVRAPSRASPSLRVI